jgi:hypothetical protein
MVIVTGFGPQSNVMTPPFATALTTAADVHPAGVPFPMTVVGLPVLTARAALGTLACPAGLPGLGSTTGRTEGVGSAVALADGDGDETDGESAVGADADAAAPAVTAGPCVRPEQAACENNPRTATPATTTTRRISTVRW